MATHIRPLREDDLDAVADLLLRVYPHHAWASSAACARYLHEVLFGHPWRDLDIPSWVAEEGAHLCGVYALMPRRMRLGARPVTVAVGCQFMVDEPRRRGLVGLQLARACLRGPQDLMIADGATDAMRRLWSHLGGTLPVGLNLHWTRVLRPMRFALSRAGGGALAAAARPMAALVDGTASRLRPNRFLRVDGEGFECDLDAQTASEQLPLMVPNTVLRPDYDASSFDWLVAQTARHQGRGRLRRRAVYDDRRRLLGWYLYFLRPGAVGEVVQLAAHGDAFAQVLDRLLVDAWRHGASALRGRFDARQALALAQRHCWARAEGPWTGFFARDPAVAEALLRGDVFFSHLDGEWWLAPLGR